MDDDSGIPNAGIETGTNNLPSYYTGLDTHNYGNENFAFTDPSTWGNGLDNAGKFILGSAISGLDGFANSGIAVANWFGADIEQRDTASDIANVDSDAGQYYTQHKSSEDVAGFVLGSLVPGLGGVKLLNAGQEVLRAGVATGEIGGTLGKAVGLLTPTSTLAKAAAQGINTAKASFSYINANTIKALASGVFQNALEGAAFETAAVATNFKSPTLDDADGWDIAKDIALGAVTSGVIGGSIEAAKTFGTIKKEVIAGNIPEKQVTFRNQLSQNSLASDKIIVAADDLRQLPGAETLTNDPDELAKLTRLRSGTVDAINNEIRTNIRSISTDDELGNTIANVNKDLNADQIQANFQNAKEIGRVGSELDSEVELEKYNKNPDMDESGDNAIPHPTKIGYIKLFGENAGNLTFEEPATTNLADVNADSKEVADQISSYGFKNGKLWDPVSGEADHLKAEARYWWASNKATIEDGMDIHENDLPLLQKVYKNWVKQDKSDTFDAETNLESVRIHAADGSKYTIENSSDLLNHITQTKLSLANDLLASGNHADLAAIAKIVDVKQSYLASGKTGFDSAKDIFAHDTANQDYNDMLVAKGLRNRGEKPVDTTFIPSYAKIAYDSSQMIGQDGKQITGMAQILARQKIQNQAVQNVAAKYFGDLYQNFTPLTSSDVINANKLGAGPGRISFANANYGTTGSKIESIGQATNVARKTKFEVVRNTLQPSGYRLLSSGHAALEFQSLTNKIHGTAEQYVLDDAGDNLVPLKLKTYQDAIKNGAENLVPPKIQDGAPLSIPIQNEETKEAIAADIKLNGEAVQSERERLAAQGIESQKDPNVWYPPRPNPRDYEHFAFVTDPTVTAGSSGHMSMIHALNADDLQQLIDKVPSNFKVITKAQSEDFHKAIGDYDYDRTINSNYINPQLKKQGIDSSFFQSDDPKKIVNDWIDSHVSRANVAVREMVNAMYEPQFEEFRRLAEQYGGIPESKLPGFGNIEADTTRNPYTSYLKTALDISQASEYPLLRGLNNVVDNFFSTAMQKVKDIWDSSDSPENLGKVNAALNSYGVRSGYQDAATTLLANHTSGRGAISKFISGANGILSALTIKLNPLYSFQHTLGAAVLGGSEMSSIIDSIKSGNSSAVGALSALKDITVPGTTDTITSATKLAANAVRNLFAALNDPTNALIQRYTRQGWYGTSLDHFKDLFDGMSVNGNESEVALADKLKTAYSKAQELIDKGSIYSGTKFTIEWNRFIAANMMDQVTSVAKKAGILGPGEDTPYINSFINRTQGNYLASQRPIIFQGPVGQAVGLFQTYQFNFMQQLFRHISEGNGKDAAMMLGLQGTLFGMNSLPAFNYINTHILGTMSGNPQHQDIYSQTYGALGKTVGDWLLYGAPSNLLQTNIYSKGDINPRNLTVIPTNPADIPIVGAFSTFFSNLKNVSSKIAAGGNVWETFLQGIEHNGVSRPLAGLAQELQVFGPGGYAFATSQKGSILGTNDLLSLASISRLAGGKPFDEAVANDAVYRMSSYAAADQVRKDTLSQAIKSSVIAGNTPSAASLDSFVQGYAALGGDQRRFNQYMLKQITTANTPQAEIIMNGLKKPGNQNMQQIMGGRDPFSNLQ